MSFSSLYPRQKIILAVLFSFVFIIIILGIIVPRLSSNKVFSGQILVWGLDNKQAMAPLIDAFTAAYPKAKVVYEMQNANDYDKALIDAFSRGQGPDVFVVNNEKISESLPYITPCSLGGSNNSIPACYSKKTLYTQSQLSTEFPEVVVNDFTSNGLLYGLPLSVDTLGLYYNKDYFNKANIAVPPTLWDGKSSLSVETTARKLRQLKKLVLSRSGIALGGNSTSIENSSDILALMMMQQGAIMKSNGQVAFDDSGSANAAAKALGFYIDFANPKSTSNNFNWAPAAGTTDINAFWQGKTAMYLGYYRDKDFLDNYGGDFYYGYTGIPQFSSSLSTGNQVNYANYYSFVVSKQSKNIGPAWQFVMGATDYDVANRYFQITKNPPAQRSLIQNNFDNDYSGPFVKQILTARSFSGFTNSAVIRSFDTMIYDALHGIALNEAISKAARTITSY
jgi:ABC-type glycerol-3-phosphate transport system substrate-binding protein